MGVERTSPTHLEMKIVSRCESKHPSQSTYEKDSMMIAPTSLFYSSYHTASALATNNVETKCNLYTHPHHRQPAKRVLASPKIEAQASTSTTLRKHPLLFLLNTSTLNPLILPSIEVFTAIQEETLTAFHRHISARSNTSTQPLAQRSISSSILLTRQTNNRPNSGHNAESH